ncbi:Nudix/MutT family protein [Calothrix sp. NIES-4071]|nr:Nudix/MutT family protein [Calothrix sp. NIES-4071]BAZ63878.1 Nudix/MutT family protein [Calothrix sp. NIES-4105]
MPDHSRPIRNAAKALIIRDHHLLAITKRDAIGVWYLLPGGGQKHGETLEQALQRECLEEIGAVVKIHNLVFVREFIGKNHLEDCTDVEWCKLVHSIDFIFACSIPDDYVLGNGTLPDEGQEKVEWLPIAKLHEYRIYPSQLKHLLMNQINSEVYLGDVS